MELISNKLYSHNQYLQEDAIDEISILLQRMDSQSPSSGATAGNKSGGDIMA